MARPIANTFKYLPRPIFGAKSYTFFAESKHLKGQFELGTPCCLRTGELSNLDNISELSAVENEPALLLNPARPYRP